MNNLKQPVKYHLPEGYHGGMAFIQSPKRNLICDLCGRVKNTLTRMGRDYPNDPDIRICEACYEDYLEDGKEKLL